MIKVKLEGTHDSIANVYHSYDVGVMVVIRVFALVRTPTCYHAAVGVGLEVVDLVTGWTVTTLVVLDLFGCCIVARHFDMSCYCWKVPSL
jgi:hypothetical protein